MRYTAQAMAILGIDIGGTQIKAGLVTAEGQVLESRRTDTPATIDEFARSIRQISAGLAERCEGAGIGCKGRLQPGTTRVEALPGTLHYLEGQELASFLPAGLAVVADNDACMALAGEIAWGAARGRRNALMLTLGTGVGGGILADGRILRGAAGIAGHLGHYTAVTEGALCICGNRGCLETIFSARAIESAASAMIHRGVATKIPSNPTCEQVFEAAAEGDLPAQRILNEATAVLAGAIAGLIFIFDPEIIILGGQIAAAGGPLFTPVRRDVWQRTEPYLRRQIPIVGSELKGDTGVAGAAALFLSR